MLTLFKNASLHICSQSDCNASDCNVSLLGCAMPIFWMVHQSNVYLQVLVCLRLYTIRVLNISNKLRHCSKVHKWLQNLPRRSSHLIIQTILFKEIVISKCRSWQFRKTFFTDNQQSKLQRATVAKKKVKRQQETKTNWKSSITEQNKVRTHVLK